jgi:uncharacterized protein YndB with AHSA1/START domain
VTAVPTFALTTHTDGPVEEVWKLLHDPARFPEWWEGVETVEVRATDGPAADYTMWPAGYPDFPMAQRLEEGPGRVTVSCLVSDLMFQWRLRESGAGTDIDVRVELPEREAHRLPEQRRLLESSLAALAVLAVAG